MKDDLKHLWDYTYPGAASRFREGWYQHATRSRTEPLKRFARKLKARLDEVMGHGQWPLHTNPLDVINNKIKVVKHMEYGFRDDDYFFFKIRAAFPGNPGWNFS